MKIKWLRLRKIVKELLNQDIDIMLISSVKVQTINAATNGKIIILNGDELKTENDVIKGVAHEVTHILNPGIDCKTNGFIIEWDKNENVIKTKYQGA